jgi:hypothetical protein
MNAHSSFAPNDQNLEIIQMNGITQTEVLLSLDEQLPLWNTKIQGAQVSYIK